MILKKVYTLVFIRNDNEILLGLKKRGFGCNKWNGFGGKLEPNESVVNAAVRELEEECCITVKTDDLKNIGRLEFTFENEPVMMDVRVYSASKYIGTPSETEEMAPKWFKLNKIPYDNMWPDDKIWFPFMLSEKLFHGQFHYKGLDTILSHKVVEMGSMESFSSDKN